MFELPNIRFEKIEKSFGSVRGERRPERSGSFPARGRSGAIVVGAGFVMDFVQFLLEPWSGAAVHRIPAAWAWHGRLMVFAGAVLFPVGVMLARYYIDTYQAIWGPDPEHPGAKRKPTGFGVRRYR